ncbi:MAG: 50S ribosomal protein L18 [Nanoarchaeota archaeon]|nr:50S ribosomal protein L18 [Nanoarchaeota archaeon]
MAKTETIRFRRKGKTDYKKRITLLKSGMPRLVVRPSLHHMQVQAIEYDEKGDIVVARAHTSELRKLGWKYGTGNMPAAYLTGLLLGKRVKHKKLVPDVNSRGNRQYAVIKGVIDAGIEVPCSIELKEDRLQGKHISSYAPQAKGNQFAKLKEQDLGKLPEEFNTIKKKIMEGADGKG